MESMTERAIKYRGYGWSVIPVHIPLPWGCSCGNDQCKYPGKHPRVNWKEYEKRLPTVPEIQEWFESSMYGSNIGVVTGVISNLVVVDVDGALEEYGKLDLPETLTALTGGGGYHFYYRCETPIRSLGQAVDGKRGFAPGIDLKAEGGFIVMPPSKHESGDSYSWLTKMAPATLDPKMLPVVPERTSRNNGDPTWYEELLLGVEEGGRSNAAARLAGRYALLNLTMDEATILLQGWNTLNVPPLDRFELRRTVKSVYQRHDEALQRSLQKLGAR